MSAAPLRDALELALSQTCGCLRCCSSFPYPGAFCGVWELKHRGYGEEGDYCRHERLYLDLMPAPVQLVGGEMSCILVVPGASRCHEERLGCCTTVGKFPSFPCYAFPVGLFFL